MKVHSIAVAQGEIDSVDALGSLKALEARADAELRLCRRITGASDDTHHVVVALMNRTGMQSDFRSASEVFDTAAFVWQLAVLTALHAGVQEAAQTATRNRVERLAARAFHMSPEAR